MPSDPPSNRDSGGSGHSTGDRTARSFRTTQWTDLLQAKNGEESGLARAGLSRICQNYWPPIYRFLRRSGYSRPDAEDLTQGFFEHLLRQDWLKNVHPGNGRFRSFLLKSLKNFCLNTHAKAAAQKRGGNEVFIPLGEINREEQYVLGASDNITPEQTFDRRWAEALMQRAINLLEEEYLKNGKGQLFSELSKIERSERGASSYAAIGARLALTEGAVKTAVHRMRARLANILRAEIQATVADRAEVDQELQYLREILGR